VDPTETSVLTPDFGSEVFRVTTLANVSGWKPYMGLPTGRRGRIDIMSRTTDTGSLEIPLQDQDLWVTGFIGDQHGRFIHTNALAVVEETRDGGVTWVPYYRGRVISLSRAGRTGYTMVLRDLADDFQAGLLFPQKPSAVVYGTGSGKYAQMLSQAPWGLAFPYGAITTSYRIDGTIVAVTLPTTPPTDVAVIELADTTHMVPKALADALAEHGASGIPDTAGDVQWGATSQQVRAIVKRTDTQAEGEFYVGAQWAWVDSGSGARPLLYSLTIKLLDYPKGIATGTPLVNNGAGYGIGTFTINTDGWTVSQTGIVKIGDVFYFDNHPDRYVVSADANSNGSGQATISFYTRRKGVNAGLQVAIADNQVLTVIKSPGFMALPPTSTAVTVTLYVDGPVQKNNPIIINDVHPAQYMKDIALGYFGPLWREGEFLPPGVSYGDPMSPVAIDTTAFTNLIADTTFPSYRVIHTERPNRAAEFEIVGQEVGIAYYFNEAGVLVPVDVRFPTSLAGVGSITDADMDMDTPPEWYHDVAAGISWGQGSYVLEAAALASWERGHPKTGTFPNLEEDIVTHHELPVIVLGMGDPSIGDAHVALQGRGIRAMVGENIVRGATAGATLSRAEWAYQMVETNLLDFASTYGNGPTIITITCRRTANVAAIQPGMLKTVTIPGNPDPLTKTLSGTRVVRVVEVRDINLGRRQIVALDLGQDQTAAVPTIGTPVTWASDTRNAIQVALTLNGAAQPAEIQYAVTATSVGTVPAETDPIWSMAPIRSRSRGHLLSFDSMTLVIYPVPSGKRIWVRARSVPALSGQVTRQLPSAWVTPSGTKHVDTTAITAPTSLVEGTDGGRFVELTFLYGDVSRYTRVYLVTPAADPLEPVMLLRPGQKRFTVYGLSLSTEYKAEVRHIDDFGGESAGANVTFTTAAGTPTAPNPATVPPRVL
jgi:hypothetical protein